MARKHSEYFDGFVELVELSAKAADYLVDVLKNYKPDDLIIKIEKLHSIEHEADEKKHVLMQKLAKEFVTPIDRTDIIQLANDIDDVTDAIEEVLLRMYMYNIQDVRPEALAFADLIVQCCKALHIALKELPNFHKSATLHNAIVDVNTIEEEGDKIYLLAMRRLFTEGGEPLEIYAWSEMFELFEDCCDACEHVAGVMETVVMNNS